MKNKKLSQLDKRPKIYMELNKKPHTKLTWKCMACEDVVESYSHSRHNMNICKCGHSGVDLKDEYERVMGGIEEIKRENYY